MQSVHQESNASLYPWQPRYIGTKMYGDLPQADGILQHWCLYILAAHAARCTGDRDQPVADLVFWLGSGRIQKG